MSYTEDTKTNKKDSSLIRNNLALKVGLGLLGLSLITLLYIYSSVIAVYAGYFFRSPDEVADKTEQIEDLKQKPQKSGEENPFIDKDFGILIPKIGANAKVVSSVNAFDPVAYTKALDKGIAHADGTSLPDKDGNIFLFAHSAVEFYKASKQNVNFYLLSELAKDDKIYISYKEKIYTYEVLEKKIVDPTDTQYLTNYRDYNTLTLMTCWPAGTNYKRVIIIAKEI